MPCLLCYLDNSIQLRKQLKPRQACNCPQRYQACGGFFLEIPPRRASLGCASRATTGRQRVSAQWATDALSCPSRQSREKPAARSRPAPRLVGAERTRPARAEGRASAHLRRLPDLQLAELLNVSRPGPLLIGSRSRLLCFQAGRDETASVPGSASPK